MLKILYDSSSFQNMRKFMFTKENFLNGYNYKNGINIKNSQTANTSEAAASEASASEASASEAAKVDASEAAATAAANASVEASEAAACIAELDAFIGTADKKNTYTPYNKGDKLFWCFYIILNGYEDYELNKSNAFAIEKQFKIQSVEKLKSIKSKLKEMKLKRTEMEDELANKQKITIKGLYALCLIHNVAITYIYDRKYINILCDEEHAKKGIIIQNDKKEDSIRHSISKYEDELFLSKIYAEYWFIYDVQKPLKAPSAYSTAELQEICEKLEIKTTSIINEKIKPKTKKTMYEEILQRI